MSDVDKLIRAMAFDRAYSIADGSCYECGLPFTRYDEWNGHRWCDDHMPNFPAKATRTVMHDSASANAVRLLMKLAREE